MSRSLAVSLAWLVRLRWASIAGQLATVLVVRLALGAPLPVAALLSLIGAAALSNLACAAWVGRGRSVSEAGVAGIMALDTLILTGLLYLTGGAENPFSFIYLVQIALAAVMLGARWTWALVALALAGSAFLFVDHLPLPHLSEGHHDHFSVHLWGMWVAFGVSASFIVYFLLRVMRALAAREADLAAARENAARQDRLGALATLAAGAAHELATPLATIAVAARELERQLDGPAGEDIALIRAQVERCRHILQQLSSDAGAPLGEAVVPVTVGEVVDAAVGELAGAVLVEADAQARAARLSAPPRALAQALRGVIRNAQDASAAAGGQVRVLASSAAARVVIEVRDRGAGMAPAVLARAGEPFFTTKEPGRGMGLGIFLCRAVVERLGGELRLSSVVGEGTTAVLSLPQVTT